MRTALVVLIAAVGCAGCDRIFDKGTKEEIAAADKKAKAGDYRAAIKLYEAALDGTAETAELHYRLAVIYDDKLKSPVDAMHHFQRYLELAPKGPFAKDAQAYKKEGDLKLLTKLNPGTTLTQVDAARLKNENLALGKLIGELRVQLRAQKALSQSTAPKGGPNEPLPPGAKTHLVQTGETLASISQKYYRTRNRSQDILDANHNQLGGKTTIRPGQTLIIP